MSAPVEKEFTKLLKIKDYIDQEWDEVDNISIKYLLVYGFFYLVWNIWRELAEIASNSSYLRRLSGL